VATTDTDTNLPLRLCATAQHLASPSSLISSRPAVDAPVSSTILHSSSPAPPAARSHSRNRALLVTRGRCHAMTMFENSWLLSMNADMRSAEQGTRQCTSVPADSAEVRDLSCFWSSETKTRAAGERDSTGCETSTRVTPATASLYTDRGNDCTKHIESGEALPQSHTQHYHYESQRSQLWWALGGCYCNNRAVPCLL
jgi:hypothetical protein